MKIYPIEAFSDNYIWLIEKESDVLVIDPGESGKVLAYLKEKKLALKGILLTHKHEDHVGGVKDIAAVHPSIPVYGPEETEGFVDHIVKEGDSFKLMNQLFHVYRTAGHTEEHISFLMGDALFCGDALFSGGCGRVFTGDYHAQYDALQKFKQMKDDVKVYPAHEYTQTNLRFAQTIEPSNHTLSDALSEANALRDRGEPTVPSTIEKEKEINLFLRADTVDAFITLRQARDTF